MIFPIVMVFEHLGFAYWFMAA